MKQHKKLSIEEREQIQIGLWGKRSIRQIAKDLNRAPSSIDREINKNKDSINRRTYIPRIAHEKRLLDVLAVVEN